MDSLPLLLSGFGSLREAGWEFILKIDAAVDRAASPGEAEVLSLGSAFLLLFIPRFVLHCQADGDNHQVINFSFSGCHALWFPQTELNFGIFPLAVQDSWGSSMRCDLGLLCPRGMPGTVCSVQPQFSP